MTRQALGEGDEYMPLVLRSNEIWSELERETQSNLLVKTGGLIIANPEHHSPQHGKSNFFDQTVSVAKRFNIKHEILSNNELKKRYPQFNVSSKEQGFFEDNAGYLRPEDCMKTQLELAEKNGAHLLRNEKVIEIIPGQSGDRVRIRTTNNEYEAEKLIITAGPWISDFIGEEFAKFKVHRQVLYWFDVKNSITPFTPKEFPVFVWIYGKTQEEAMYGFPAIDGDRGGVKISSEQYSEGTTAETVERTVTTAEIKNFHETHLKDRIPGLLDKCIKSATCLYTVGPDSQFIIDFHPHQKNIILASPCAGHGFKHSAAIGEILSELAIDGSSKIDISMFKLRK